jgi:TetR/AcrR family transcriptional repressor of nem operon
MSVMEKGQKTRAAILQKGLQLIYERGFYNTSLDELLAAIPITKGSFYHHFRSKDDMGLAIIAEVLQPAMHDLFDAHVQDAHTPVASILGFLRALLFQAPDLKPEFGCPIGNLSQELANAGHVFREALTTALDSMHKPMMKYLQRAKAVGVLRQDAKPADMSRFIIASYWGLRIVGKLGDSTKVYKSHLNELKRYLEAC